MALVRLPGGEQRSGRIGGIVWSTGKGGAYIRAASIPVNPSSNRQQEVRAHMSSLSTQWGIDLTQDQRDAWSAWAAERGRTNRLGAVIYLSGQQAYVSSNAPRLQAGLDQVDDPPASIYDAPALSGFSVEASAASGDVTITWSGFYTWEDQDDASLLLSISRPVAAARTYNSSPYRFMGQIPGDSGTPPTSPTDVACTAWPLIEGQRLWCRARMTLADGRLAPWREYNFLCGA